MNGESLGERSLSSWDHMHDTRDMILSPNGENSHFIYFKRYDTSYYILYGKGIAWEGTMQEHGVRKYTRGNKHRRPKVPS